MRNKITFKFKEFEIAQDRSIMKVNTDAVLLGAWSYTSDKRMALDIGTGSGIIAIMLAQKNINLHITGIEIDLNSFEQAEQNMQNSPFADRLSALFTSFQDFTLTHSRMFDLIISNPPFFTEGPLSENKNKAGTRHTIKLSHAELLQGVVRHLSPAGHFDLILPYYEGLKIIDLARQYELYAQHVTEVKSTAEKKIERLLIRFCLKKEEKIERDELIIYQSPTANDYSQAFTALTKDFYLFL